MLDQKSSSRLQQNQESFDFSQQGPKIYQVTELVRTLTQCVEGQFFRIFVEGEIDGFTAHARTGHWYFVIKDQFSSLPAIMLRTKNQKLSLTIKNGLTVRVIGKISLYEPQGKLQLHVDEIQLTGDGALKQALEELKQKLQSEGLFLEQRKRKLPLLPQKVGIVTSKSGAVLRDIVRVAFRRGKTAFLLAPCAVQGENAPIEIKRAIEQLQSHVEVIIVARGGGSSTDLSPFNDERVVRAIAASNIPVVSAIGHEVDTTLSDLAADVRASTPSAAAELVVPVYAEFNQLLLELQTRLVRSLDRKVSTLGQTLDLEQSKLFSMGRQLIGNHRRTLLQIRGQLNQEHPKTKLIQAKNTFSNLHKQLVTQIKILCDNKRQSFEAAGGKLDALSPLRVLTRGYCIATNKNSEIIKTSQSTQPGEELRIRLLDGSLECQVIRKI